jgi:hypothetical protein
MKSTTTRLAASVLAIAIPFAPTAAHADSNTKQSSDAAIHTAALQDAAAATTHLDIRAREAIAHAIDSAAHAARQSLALHEKLRSSDQLAASFHEELITQTATALDATYAEVTYARTLIPRNAPALAATLDLIIADVAQLRSAL